MPLLRKKRTIAAKVETTVGTAESLAAADGVFNAYDIELQGDIQVEEREGQGGFDRLAGVPGQRGGTMSFKTDLEWDGSTTMPTWASVLFPGCGVVESSQVYTPRSEAPGSNVKTLTLGVYEDGKLKTLAGSVGNFRIVMPSGRKCFIEWEFTGVWQAVTDTTMITPTYPSDEIIRFASATLTYDSVDLCVEQLSLDCGNEMIYRECPDTAAGYKSALVTDRYPVIEGNPEAQLEAEDPRYADWLAGSEAALSVVLAGPAGGSSDADITISVPAAQIFNVQVGERNKLIIDDVTWHANKNGANQDQCFSITFNELVA